MATTTNGPAAIAFAGFSSPNGTIVPDEVFDVLMPQLGDAELRVLMYVIRRTFGFKKSSDDISLGQITGGIVTRDGVVLDRGAGVGKTAAVRAVKGLVAKGILLARRNQSRERGNEPTTYALRFRSDPLPAAPLFTKGTRGASSRKEQALVHQGNTQQTDGQQTDFDLSKFEGSETISQANDPEPAPRAATIAPAASKPAHPTESPLGAKNRVLDDLTASEEAPEAAPDTDLSDGFRRFKAQALRHRQTLHADDQAARHPSDGVGEGGAAVPARRRDAERIVSSQPATGHATAGDGSSHDPLAKEGSGATVNASDVGDRLHSTQQPTGYATLGDLIKSRQAERLRQEGSGAAARQGSELVDGSGQPPADDATLTVTLANDLPVSSPVTLASVPLNGSPSEPASPSLNAFPEQPASMRINPSRRGRPPGSGEEREILGAYLSDFARELSDQAPLSSSITRAVKSFKLANVPRERWADFLYQAKSITQERSGQIKKQAPKGTFQPKPKMGYFFAVLEDLLGLKEHKMSALPGAKMSSNTSVPTVPRTMRNPLSP
jgi:hypothetical protein